MYNTYNIYNIYIIYIIYNIYNIYVIYKIYYISRPQVLPRKPKGRSGSTALGAAEPPPDLPTVHCMLSHSAPGAPSPARAPGAISTCFLCLRQSTFSVLPGLDTPKIHAPVQTVGELQNPLPGTLAGWLHARNWHFGCLTDWLAGWPAGWLAGIHFLCVLCVLCDLCVLPIAIMATLNNYSQKLFTNHQTRLDRIVIFYFLLSKYQNVTIASSRLSSLFFITIAVPPYSATNDRHTL